MVDYAPGLQAEMRTTIIYRMLKTITRVKIKAIMPRTIMKITKKIEH